MAAIITDQIRVLNAKNFVSDVGINTYYSFIGLPNPTDYQTDWNNNPPSPKDNFDQENDYWDTMVALKKVNTADVRQVVPKDNGHLVQLMITIVMIIVDQTLQKCLVQQTYILHHIL